MFNKLVLVGVLSIVAAAASAAEPQQRGGYIGGAFGSSLFDDDGAFTLDFDDGARSFQGHAGYRFFRHFAVEGRYSNYGTFTLQSADLGVKAVSAHALGIIPFGASGWELFGQLGVGSLKLDFAGTEETETTFAGGLGVRYFATRAFSIGVQTDVHVWEDDSPGTSYVLGVGATQLAIQLHF